MSFVVVGTNYKYAPVQIREKFAFFKKRLKPALKELCGRGGINAAVILSTCNRVELYIDTEDADLGIKTLKDFLAGYHHRELNHIASYLYTYIGKEAVLHLFQVASGIDSQIIGESQVLGQVRTAYEEAKEAGTLDDFLTHIFLEAINTGIKIRDNTEISKGDISIANIAISLMQERYGDLQDKKVLVIGVGKISELVIGELKKEQVKATFISNRTYERALELARYIEAEVVRFDQLREKLNDTDIIISATSSPHLILKKEDLLGVKKPLLIIDLAVPRDVDPHARYIPGISLFCLDDLNFMIDKKLEARIKEIPKALEIIKEEVENLWSWVEHLELEPELVRLP